MRIRTYFGLTAVAVLMPVLFAAVVAVEKVREGARQAALRGLHETVRATSLLVDREIQGSIWALRALGNSVNLETGNFKALYEQAKALNRPPDVWTLVLDDRGTQVLNTVIPFGSDPPPAVALSRVEQVLARQEPLISDVLVGPVTGKMLTVVDVPALAAGGRKYVVTQAFTVDHWKKTALQPEGRPDWIVAVLDRNGRFIARSHGAETYLGKDARPELVAAASVDKEGLIRHHTLEGVESYDAFAHSSLTGWTIAVAAPVETIEASARQAVLWLGAGMATALLFAVLVAWLLGRRFIEAIHDASSAARVLGKGERPRTRPTSIEEIEILNEALTDAGSLLEVESKSRRAAEAELEQLLVRETAARETAEAENLAKTRFLAMLGHEIRNPLAAISGASALLATGGQGGERFNRYLQIITRQNSHLAHIVDDLLDISRLLAGKISLNKETFDLADSIEACIDSLRATERASSYTLLVEAEELWIEADKVRVEQIVSNLVINAMKFSSAGSPIRVTLRGVDDKALVEVIDQGCGMSKELMAQIFDPFFQGPAGANRSQGGLGIGLALVKQLVELHGGSITAASAGLGKGSRFSVTFQTVQTPIKPAAVRSPPRRDCRVLLVEDNADVRALFAEIIRMGGHTVLEAADGATALALASNSKLDIGIVDIGLPDMDGYIVAMDLRRQATTRSMRLIALTGYGQEVDKNRAMVAGFDEHLVKPVEPDVLLKLIDRLAHTPPDSA